MRNRDRRPLSGLASRGPGASEHRPAAASSDARCLQLRKSAMTARQEQARKGPGDGLPRRAARSFRRRDGAPEGVARSALAGSPFASGARPKRRVRRSALRRPSCITRAESRRENTSGCLKIECYRPAGSISSRVGDSRLCTRTIKAVAKIGVIRLSTGTTTTPAIASPARNTRTACSRRSACASSIGR